MTVAPIGKFGDMEIAVGANGAMLLAVVVMQLLAALKMLAGWIFDSSKKKEEQRDKLLEDLTANVSKIAHEIQIMKHTMITEEDIQKSVQLEIYKMNHKGQRP